MSDYSPLVSTNVLSTPIIDIVIHHNDNPMMSVIVEVIRHDTSIVFGLSKDELRDVVAKLNAIVDGGNNIVYSLSCDDASHLGGPMGSEYTTHLWTKVFGSVDDAKAYAVDYQTKHSGSGRWPTWASWTRFTSGSLGCDSGAFIWKIDTIDNPYGKVGD